MGCIILLASCVPRRAERSQLRAQLEAEAPGRRWGRGRNWRWRRGGGWGGGGGRAGRAPFLRGVMSESDGISAPVFPRSRTSDAPGNIKPLVSAL
jgi:hypothetical protein